MGFRIPATLLSVAAVSFSIYCLATKGLNYGVDFAGGLEIVASFPQSKNVQADEVRESLNKAGIGNATVQKFGTEIEERPSEYIVHFSGDFADPEVMKEKMNTALGGTSADPALKKFRFSGLEKAYITLSQEKSLSEIQSAFEKIDFALLQFLDVTPFGRETSREYEVRFKSIANTILGAWNQEFSTPTEQVELQKVDFVGAKVGSDLKTGAILSILITIFLIFIYIFLRFDFVYSPGVVVALIHDLIITTGLFSFLEIEFDLTVVAALLTIAGYSINDTIVVYDRIREVSTSLLGKKMVDIIDIAINETMSRTIITSLTTLLATATLWYFGGTVIHSFALAMTVGVITGTYSTVFIASTMIVWIDDIIKKKDSTGKKKAKAA